MAYCSQCGTEIPADARFCPGCGRTVDTGAATAPAGDTDPALSMPPSAPTPGHSSARVSPSSVSPAPVSRGPAGWVLPALVLIALAAIAYLLLWPRSGAEVTTAEQAGAPATATGPAGSAGGSGDRAVDQATTAADAAGAGAAAAGSFTSAAVIDSAFFSNPEAAALRFAGPVRVSGVIATMVQPGATPSLSMEGRTRFNYIVVNFPAGYRERLAPLSKGQFISVACDSARSLGGTTILSGCLLS